MGTGIRVHMRRTAMKTIMKALTAILILVLSGCAGAGGNNYQSTMKDEGMITPGDVPGNYPPYFHPRR
jgi:hypothetical protein